MNLQLKLKKLQLEHERIWQIENENRRLLSRLAEIMSRARSSCKARFSVYNSKCVSIARTIMTIIGKSFTNLDGSALESKCARHPSRESSYLNKEDSALVATSKTGPSRNPIGRGPSVPAGLTRWLLWPESRPVTTTVIS